MTVSLPTVFVEWAARLGYSASADGAALVLANEGGELRYSFRERAGGVELLRAERADDPAPVLVAADVDDAVRHLVTVLGYDHRAANGLTTIRLPFDWSAPAAGYTPLELEHGWAGLRHDTTGALVVSMVDQEVVHPVIMFSYVASAPITDLIASFDHPLGAPLLEQFVS